MRRRWPVRRRLRPRRAAERAGGLGAHGHGLLWPAALGLCLALLLIRGVDSRVRPVFSVMASAKVNNSVVLAVNESIDRYITDHSVKYEDIIALQYSGNGRITALTSNIAAINSLRTGLAAAVIESISGIDAASLAIPVGNLTGFTLLSGRGFELSVRVLTKGTAQIEFVQEFLEAGINQTLHRITADVTVSLSILLPMERVEREVRTQVCVAETVIVGEVPSTYLNLQQKTGGN